MMFSLLAVMISLSTATATAADCEPYLEVRLKGTSLLLSGGRVSRCGSDGDLNVAPNGLPVLSRKLSTKQLARFRRAVKLAQHEIYEINGAGRRTPNGGREKAFKLCEDKVFVRIGKTSFETCAGLHEYDVAHKIDMLIRDVYSEKY